MARCRGATQAGERCRREAGDSGYCYIHQDQAESGDGAGHWEEGLSDTAKVVLGVGLLAALLFLPIPFLRRRC